MVKFGRLGRKSRQEKDNFKVKLIIKCVLFRSFRFTFPDGPVGPESVVTVFMKNDPFDEAAVGLARQSVMLSFDQSQLVYMVE